jgi:hypothetical protein
MFFDARKRAKGQYCELLLMGGARGPHKRMYVGFWVFLSICVTEGEEWVESVLV